MNYLQQLNAFYTCLHTQPLTTRAVALYGLLLHLDNRCGWLRSFTVANSTLMGLGGFSKRQLEDARAELKQKGLIDYRPGSGRMAGRYRIPEMTLPTGAHGEPQGGAQTGVQTGAQPAPKPAPKRAPLSKPDPTQPDPTEEIVAAYRRLCPDLPQARLTARRQKAIRARLREGYRPEDFETVFRHAQMSDFYSGRDGKWEGCGLDWLLSPDHFVRLLEWRPVAAPSQLPEAARPKAAADYAADPYSLF